MSSSECNYFTDEANYGRYQYVSLVEVVDSLLLEAKADDDHYLKNTDRALLVKYAREGIKELTYEAARDIMALEMTLGDNLLIPIPPDYVNWVRVSVVDENNQLQPLNVNRKSNTAEAYLQDHWYEIVLDSNNCPIEVDGNNVYNEEFKRLEFNRSCLGGYFQTDTSQLSKFGEFDVNERKGVIAFSSNLVYKDIVVEYISDGLNWQDVKNTEIKVHKFIETPLMDFIYMKAIERRRNVPQNEKDRAVKRYYKNKHIAKKRRANFSAEEISKAARSALKWVKT